MVKFLVTVKELRDMVAALPPKQIAALLQAARKYMNALLADGTADCAFTFPDGAGVAILNADTHEALMDLLLEFPLYTLSVWDIKPLCDIDHFYDKFLEVLQEQKG